MLPIHITNNNPLHVAKNNQLQRTNNNQLQLQIIIIIKIIIKHCNYKQHITHKHYKSGMCMYIYQMKTYINHV